MMLLLVGDRGLCCRGVHVLGGPLRANDALSFELLIPVVAKGEEN